MRPGCTFKADSGKYFKDEFFLIKSKILFRKILILKTNQKTGF